MIAFGSTVPQPGSAYPATGPTFAPSTTMADTDVLRPDQPKIPAPAATATPVDEPIDPARYVLGPNDVLELHFWGIENFRLRVTVDLEGRGFVPKVGYLDLQGKTLAEGQRMLRESVARSCRNVMIGWVASEAS